MPGFEPVGGAPVGGASQGAYQATAMLVVTDNGDGTIDYVVNGVSGATYNVYYAPLSALPDPDWTLLDQVTEGDTNTAPLPNGYYFGYAYNLYGTDFAPPVYFYVTSTDEAVATRFRAAIKARIQLLALDGIASDRIYEQWTPDETNLDYPCIVLTPQNVRETVRANFTNTSDIGRPCRVLICDRVDKLEHDKLPRYELWRQQIERAFSEQQLPAPFENVICKIEHDAIIDPHEPAFQMMVSEFAIRGIMREPRGLGA